MTQNSSSINLETVVRFLLETELFSHLTTSELSEMTTILEIQRYSKGETIFQEGDIGDAWYVLYEGSVSVRKHVFLCRNNLREK